MIKRFIYSKYMIWRFYYLERWLLERKIDILDWYFVLAEKYTEVSCGRKDR